MNKKVKKSVNKIRILYSGDERRRTKSKSLSKKEVNEKEMTTQESKVEPGTI